MASTDMPIIKDTGDMWDEIIGKPVEGCNCSFCKYLEKKNG